MTVFIVILSMIVGLIIGILIASAGYNHHIDSVMEARASQQDVPKAMIEEPNIVFIKKVNGKSVKEMSYEERIRIMDDLNQHSKDTVYYLQN